VLALVAVIVAAAVRETIRSPDRLSSRVALGCALVVAWQAGLHAGVNLGLLPVVSTPGLPLVSYGGSATVATLVCVGLVARGLLRPVEAGGAGAAGRHRTRPPLPVSRTPT
jgi:cell division protein FtsW (lipid II flippase)